MSELTIGEIAAQVNLKSSAIRFYERIGLLPEPKRVSGQRRYTKDVLQQIRFIQLAQYAGFSNDEIAIVIDGFASNAAPTEGWQRMAHEKLDELNAMSRRIDSMKQVLNKGLKCECLSWDECINNLELEEK